MCATDQQHLTRPAQPSSRRVIGQATVPAVTATCASGLNDARTALKERARRAHATLARLVWCDAKSRIAAFALQPRSTLALLSSTEAYPRSFRLFHTLRLERKKKILLCKVGSSFCSFRPFDIAGPSIPNWVVGAQSGRSGARTSMREGGWVLSNSSAQCLFFVFSASACTVLA